MDVAYPRNAHGRPSQTTQTCAAGSGSRRRRGFRRHEPGQYAAPLVPVKINGAKVPDRLLSSVRPSKTCRSRWAAATKRLGCRGSAQPTDSPLAEPITWASSSRGTDPLRDISHTRHLLESRDTALDAVCQFTLYEWQRPDTILLSDNVEHLKNSFDSKMREM